MFLYYPNAIRSPEQKKEKEKKERKAIFELYQETFSKALGVRKNAYTLAPLYPSPPIIVTLSRPLNAV